MESTQHTAWKTLSANEYNYDYYDTLIINIIMIISVAQAREELSLMGRA